MVRKNLRTLILGSILVGAVLTGCSSQSGNPENSSSKSVSIGITQIAEHPALDSARDGFLKSMAENGFKDGENLKIDYQNAQGDISTAQIIAQNFSTKGLDAILAIGTPTAQAAFNSTKEIPIGITAITDPVEAGLVKSWAQSETNVFGTSDMTPVESQLNLLKKLSPNAKTLGVMFNTSEANSEAQVKLLKNLCAKVGLEVIDVGVTSVNDIPQALESLLKKIDVLYTPADNVIASSMALISSKAIELKIPIIGAEEAHVTSGALATDGINYENLGRQTAEMVVEVLKGKTPSELGVKTLKETEIVINKTTAKALGIEIPKEVLNSAKVIE